MASSQSTRRLEMALPHIGPIGRLMEARLKAKADPLAMTAVLDCLADVATARAIRRLSAISRATDLELKMGEADPTVITQLEDLAAERPITDAMGDAMELFGFALGLSGVTPGYFADAPADSDAPTPTKDPDPASPSGA